MLYTERPGGGSTPRAVATPSGRCDVPKRTCDLDSCDRKHSAHGMCQKHYMRWRAHGDPHFTLTTPPGTAQRWLNDYLADLPSSSGACVEWPYMLDHGYGRIRSNGRMRYVTHIVLEHTGRQQPPAPRNKALHSCDNPPCIHPAHLRWGTQAENVDDRERADRTARGETSGANVLTRADVIAIRARYAAGDVLQRELADEYGVGSTTIGSVINRDTWRHVN